MSKVDGVLIVGGVRHPFTVSLAPRLTIEIQDKEIELCVDHECAECMDCLDYMDDLYYGNKHICCNPKNRK